MEYATLNNGVKMPMAGIGTFLLTPDEAEASCVSALQEWLSPDRHRQRLCERKGSWPRYEEVRLAAGGDFSRNQAVAQLL